MDVNVSGDDTGYAYAVGLVSGLHGRLLKGRDFEALASAPGVAEALASLDATPYAEGIRRLGSGYALVDLEAAFAAHMRAAYMVVSSAVPEGDRSALDCMFLGGWDMDNVRTVSRAISSKAPVEEALKMMFPYGLIGREQLRGLLSSSSLEELAMRLPKHYSEMVAKSMPKKQKPVEFEEELQRLYVSGLLADSKNTVRDYAGLYVDALNIRTIIRCKVSGADASVHILGEGRHIASNRMSQVLRQDLAGVSKILEDTPYGRAVKESLTEVSAGNFAGLDRRLRAVLDSEAENAAILRPLSVGTVIAYLRRKEEEVRKVRAVVAGKWHGLGAEELKAVAL
jgi:vacuolar-type H+-ATPase subunit C/Vma6